MFSVVPMPTTRQAHNHTLIGVIFKSVQHISLKHPGGGKFSPLDSCDFPQFSMNFPTYCGGIDANKTTQLG